jgi:type II secretory pathway component GspD/PulD (secretin)
VFGAILNAVKSDTRVNILSTPSIMTLDNQEAKLLVGQEVPVTTGEALSTNFDNAFRTVQRQNVGIQLDVKPQVNSSGSIKLFLRQEVSSDRRAGRAALGRPHHQQARVQDGADRRRRRDPGDRRPARRE